MPSGDNINLSERPGYAECLNKRVSRVGGDILDARIARKYLSWTILASPNALDMLNVSINGFHVWAETY